MVKALPINRISNRSHTGIFVKNTLFSHETPVETPHRDDYYMFALLLEGEARVRVDFKSLSLRADQGVILAPGQVHYPEIYGPVPAAWMLFASPENIPPTAPNKIERYALATTCIDFSDENMSDISNLMDMLHRHVADTEFSQAIVAAIVNRFCASLHQTTVANHERYETLTLRFKHLLDTSYIAEKRPAAYASRLNVSRVYLNEAVKAVTGVSVGAFIRGHVILNAKRLLLHTTLTINEISDKLGYDDYSYFIRLFRHETGITPAEFRKKPRSVL